MSDAALEVQDSEAVSPGTQIPVLIKEKLQAQQLKSLLLPEVLGALFLASS